MSTNPVSSPDAGIDSQIALERATPVVWRNNRLLCWATMFMGLMAAVFGVCMVILGLSYVFPLGQLNVGRAFSALIWICIGIGIAGICPQFWGLGRVMAGYKVLLDERGATFHLGTKTRPSDHFLDWNKIAAVKYQRAGNAKQFTVEGKNGSEVTFTSYTFFRPKKVAQLIADRTGLPIEKGA